MSILNIFSDKKFEKALNSFNKSIAKTPSSDSNEFTDNLVGQALKQALDTNESTSDLNVDELFNNITISRERLARYNTYDELFSAVQLIKRIVVLYLNNLLQRDPITNKTILIKATEEASDVGQVLEYETFAKEFLKYYKIEDRIRSRTAPDVLKHGDSYIEVVNLEEVDIDFPLPDTKKKNQKKSNIIGDIKSDNINVISENEFLAKLNSKNGYNRLNINDFSDLLDNFIEFDNGNNSFDTDFSVIEESKNKNNIKDHDKFSKILLKFHKPHSVIPLITEYDSVLGYIEVQETQAGVETSHRVNHLINFANIINQISASSYVGGENKTEKSENVVKIFTDALTKKILSKYNINYDLKKNDKEFSDHLKKTLRDDLYYSIKKLVASSSNTSLFRTKLKVRYIKPEDMFHFTNVSTGTYFPYGDSIIDRLIFPGKLYLLTQLANAVTRLSRSSIMRKWTIETGSREDVNSLLQKLKKNLKNQRVTGEDIATSKNLPNILSDYKDMVTFKKKGNTFIDLDVLNSGDPNVNVRDLEDLRRELISLSGVPSSYLGYQDVTDLREQLVNANIVFANEISAIQKSFNDNLSALLARVSEISGFKKSEELTKNINVSLIAPTVLVLQNIESSINSVSTIQRVFAEIPEIDVDPMYLLRRYCPMIDWTEFEKEANDFKQRKKVRASAGVDSAAGGGYGGY